MAGSREVSAPTTLAPVLSFAGFMVENGQPLPEISKVHLSDVPSTVLACLHKFMKKVSVGTCLSTVDRPLQGRRGGTGSIGTHTVGLRGGVNGGGVQRAKIRFLAQENKVQPALTKMGEFSVATLMMALKGSSGLYGQRGDGQRLSAPSSPQTPRAQSSSISSSRQGTL